MKQAIVLVESHYRSRSWFRALKDIGLTHIISVMPEEFKLFRKAGIPEKNILNLYYDGLNYDKTDLTNEYFETFLNIKLNAIVCMDRTLRKKSNYYIRNYLNFLLNKINNFFLMIKPKVIFIEPTWAHEILICKFAKKYSVPIIAPVKDKLLPDRFLAFKDENHLNFYKNPSSINSNELARKAFNSVIENKPIQYFKKFNNRNKIDFKKIPKLYRLIKLSLLDYRNPNIQNSVFSDIFIKFASIIRARYQLTVLDFKKIENVKQKYILITLHVQPEASIDVVGSKYADQIEFIKNISITTPNEYVLLVKEHSHAIGNRSTLFYKNLINIPNVVLLHPNENSRTAIKKAHLVISNTGTSSLEAAMLGIKAVTATKMFYKNIMIKNEFNPLETSVEELLKSTKTLNHSKLMTYLNSIYQGSFHGNCGDFQTDKNVIQKNNIEKLKNSFQQLIKSI